MWIRLLLLLFIHFHPIYSQNYAEHLEQKTVFISGVAGFIGYSVAERLLDAGIEVHGCDILHPYYDVQLKKDRLSRLVQKGLQFYPVDVRDIHTLHPLFERVHFDEFIHLAAQAGVRHSLNRPEEYIEHNICGFFQVLEFCQKQNGLRLIYASSSSVYGNTPSFPQRESMVVDAPNSLYSATKISNEMFARVYNHVHGLRSVGLRFFTVYGPWGRPDMAHFLFADAIEHERALTLFNNGELYRDFTYIDDIVNGICRVIDSTLDFEIINLGKGNPDKVADLVLYLEQALSKKAQIISKPLSSVEVEKTYADISKARALLKYTPAVSLKEGVHKYITWFKMYYRNRHPSSL